MNKIVLIGNGFDLAHHIATRYTDFILWYLNKAIEDSSPKLSYEDQLLKFENSAGSKYKINSLGEFKKLESLPGFKFKVKSTFFQRIITLSLESGWVDIERLYFSELVELFKSYDQVISERGRIKSELLKELNTSFDFIKSKLQEYLLSIDYSIVKIENNIRENFNEYVFKEIFSKQVFSKEENDKILFLNFNYSSTIELYLQHDLIKGKMKIINIHGKLDDQNNPIIFGYGDEMDTNYEKLERLNINEFLTKFKSFGYFKTKNYQDFTKFLEIGDFEVLIMGHSCGLSDRILLNSIFEHKFCKSIRIFYYQKDENNDDYFDKTIEISRHFTAEGKRKMRDKIVPHTKSDPLKRYKG
jgi:hypothetical protein